MSKVKLEVLKPWITKKIVDMLGIEDDVVTGFIFSQVNQILAGFIELKLFHCISPIEMLLDQSIQD